MSVKKTDPHQYTHSKRLQPAHTARNKEWGFTHMRLKAREMTQHGQPGEICVVMDGLYSLYTGPIHGRNWDQSIKSFPLCYSQSPLLTDFTPPLPRPLSKNGLKMV
jgi:hypothetical protein